MRMRRSFRAACYSGIMRWPCRPANMVFRRTGLLGRIAFLGGGQYDTL